MRLDEKNGLCFMAVTFGKINNIEHAQDRDYTSSIQMSIDNAPTRLIVKYITDMYEKPLEAAVRETVSNALDGMTSAGKGFSGLKIWYEKIGDGIVCDTKEPVRSTDDSSASRRGSSRAQELEDNAHKLQEYRNSNERDWLCVMDDGCGMTYDDLVEIYTQYGVSSKRHENNTTGAFGLGAKSPLAFTNEMQVITKTKQDGCLFVNAYRTDVDDFVANLPVSVGKDGADITYYRTSKGKVIPPDEKDGKYSAKLVEQEGMQKVFLHIEDPFTASTGTLVRFPIGVRSDIFHKRFEDTPGEVALAERFTNAIQYLLHGCGQYDDPNQKDSDRNGRFFPVGEYRIQDSVGNDIACTIYVSDGLACHTYTHFARVFKELADGQLDASLVAFKVGGWVYPADGSDWTRESRSDYDAFASFPILIDVPSSAFVFVPSRDRFMDSKDNRDNIRAILLEAARHLRDLMTCPDRMSELCNWIRSTSYSNSALDAARDIAGYGTAVAMDEENDFLHVGDHTFTLSALDAWEKMSFYDLRATTNVAVGKIIWKPKFEKFSNEGVYCMPQDFTAQSVACEYSKRVFEFVEVGRDETDEKQIESAHQDDRQVVRREFPCGGFAFARTKAAADDVISIPVTPITCRYNAKTERESHVSGKYAPTPVFPVGMAIPCMTHNLSCVIALIDASRKGTKFVRKNIENIFDNLAAEDVISTSKMGATNYYIMIPPKTDDENDNWTPDEIEAIRQEVEGIVGDKSNLVHVTWRDLYRLCKATKPVDVKNDFDDFETMLKRHDIYEVRKTRELVESSKGVFSHGGINGVSMVNANRRYPDAAATLAFMKESPEKIGFIVTDERRPDPFTIAAKFASAAEALDIMPDNIEYFVCLSSRNFNEKRARALAKMGIITIYDETDKSHGRSAIPAHTLSLDCDEEVYGLISLQKQFKKNPELQAKYAEQHEHFNMADLSSYNIDKKIEHSKVVYTGAENRFLRAYIAHNFDDTVRFCYESRMATLLPISGYISPINPDWVEKLTFGHEKIDHAFNKERLEPWREKLLADIYVPEDLHKVKLDQLAMQRYEMCLDLWRHMLDTSAIMIDGKLLDDAHIDALCSIGCALGVKKMLDAWYDHKIPLEDILAGSSYMPSRALDDNGIAQKLARHMQQSSDAIK